MIKIERYKPEWSTEWDEAVKNSKNGTFMHLRGYMDYHSHRFNDMSLVARDEGRIVAILPACVEGDTLFSHKGLTYGGWLMPLRHFDVTTMLKVWTEATGFLQGNGVKHIIYKPVPHIYHRYPAEEDLYAAFCAGALLTGSNISSTIDLDEPLPFDRGNKSNLNAAIKSGVVVNVSEDWQSYWQMLNNQLQKKYSKQAVHSLEEILLLQERFPNNIKLYVATLDDELLAGVVMYFCGYQVAHSQYIASTEQGRKLKALPLLFDWLIKDCGDAGYKYFDFGISTENGGLYLNDGLAQQKSRLGGRGVVYNTYKIDI